MQTIHLLCGVPGSGKTWIAKQLNSFNYIPHDDFPVSDYHEYLLAAAKRMSRPVLGEAPFRISILIDKIKAQNVPVKTYYISEPEHLIKQRYEKRDLKPWPKQHATNLQKYNQRQWDTKGSAQEILNLLRKV